VTPLVVTDRLYIYSTAFCQYPNRQVVAHLYLPLDPVLWYGL
jgi:hypothetical protein